MSNRRRRRLTYSEPPKGAKEAGAGSSQPIDGGTYEKDDEFITPSLQSHGEEVVAEGNVPALTTDVAH